MVAVIKYDPGGVRLSKVDGPAPWTFAGIGGIVIDCKDLDVEAWTSLYTVAGFIKDEGDVFDYLLYVDEEP